nr:prohead core scaffold and protease [uncultured Mediterranean phage uvMED]|tara:strand:- start:1173 stop:1823 length:651 start_codon:yes stop_codon:yes gene_type:complete
MKLITEQIEDVQILSEEKNGKKNLYIEGTFLQGEIKNRNGRMYPINTLVREVAKYNESYVKSGRALGELGHPDGPTVNLDRVSHLITSLVQEGNNFRGRARILDTPMGNITRSLLDEGVKLGVSSRGIGSLQETRDGSKVVADDFMLATAADIVADPSAPDAFVNGIMEGKEWVWNNGLMQESEIAIMKKQIDNAANQRVLEERKISAFSNFLNTL